VAAEDDRERPQVADDVGGRVAGEHERRLGAGEDREQDVVLEHLPARLAPDPGEQIALLAPGDVAGAEPLDLEVVQATPHSKNTASRTAYTGLPR
jgi:hypothetical protein